MWASHLSAEQFQTRLSAVWSCMNSAPSHSCMKVRSSVQNTSILFPKNVLFPYSTNIFNIKSKLFSLHSQRFVGGQNNLIDQ